MRDHEAYADACHAFVELPDWYVEKPLIRDPSEIADPENNGTQFLEWYTHVQPVLDDIPNFGEAHPGLPPKARGSVWQEWYARYLRSTEWYDLRYQVLRRDKCICQGCQKGPANEVHHLTYRDVGYEFLFQLVTLCRKCHARYHRKEVE